MYEYAAKVLKVIDGDTVDLTLDLGFHTSRTERFRLLGINAPESAGADACDAGKAAKEWLVSTLPVGKSVVVRTERDRQEKYGRFLATIFLDGVDLNAEMISLGHAKPYDGTGPRT